MPKQLIIGICGPAGSGKSTASRILSQHHRFVRKPFAYPLKSMLAALGVPADVLDGDCAIKEQPRAELLGMTTRHALQTLGTEWGRKHMDDAFWVGLWQRGIKGLPRLVADDVRFPNEVEAIRKLGGYVIRIHRKGAGSKTGATHSSEDVSRLGFDFSIDNNGSIEDLHRAINSNVAELIACLGLSVTS